MSKEPEELEAVERAHITRVFLEHGRNVTKAASALGLARTTLYRKLRRYEMFEPSPVCPTCGAERGAP